MRLVEVLDDAGGDAGHYGEGRHGAGHYGAGVHRCYEFLGGHLAAGIQVRKKVSIWGKGIFSRLS